MYGAPVVDAAGKVVSNLSVRDARVAIVGMDTWSIMHQPLEASLSLLSLPVTCTKDTRLSELILKLAESKVCSHGMAECPCFIEYCSFSAL